MRISRENQHAAADIALRALARALCAVSMFDKRVAADIESLGGGFSFAVCAGSAKSSPSVRIKTCNGRFTRADSREDASDVVIRFKDVSGAMPVLLGKISVASAFAQHRMLVSGSMNQAVTLVRIIEIAEVYVFPKFIIKKAMRKAPKKQAPKAFVYIMMLFFGSNSSPDSAKTAKVSGEGINAADYGEQTQKSGEHEKGLEAVK